MKYDEEENMMIDMISESNEDILNALYEKYVPLIEYLVKKYSHKARELGLEKIDLMQEANLAFSDAIHNFNPDGEASLKTFISLCVERRLIKVLEKNSTQKSQMEKHALSLDYEYDQDGSALTDFIADASLDPSMRYLEKEELEDLKKRIQKRLSNFEYQVYEYMIQGYDYQKIAEILDKNPKQIDNTIQRIRVKLRYIMEGEKNV